MATTDLPENSIQPENRAAWRAWLQKHHTRTGGIWLVTYKKASGNKGLTYEEGVEEALCFGWIDSKALTLDQERSMLWYAPRKPRSVWSGTNKKRIERLMASGLMMPPGLAKIEAAKLDGSWNALDAIEAMEIPADLAGALASHERAREYFDAFPGSVKRGILAWIASAKREETRAKRVQETARLAAKNIRAHQPRK